MGDVQIQALGELILSRIAAIAAEGYHIFRLVGNDIDYTADGIRTIKGRSGSPNSTTRFLKALEAALHNGRDGADGLLIGEKTGELSELDSYEKLEAAFLDQVRAVARREIRAHEWNR